MVKFQTKKKLKKLAICSVVPTWTGKTVREKSGNFGHTGKIIEKVHLDDLDVLDTLKML